MKKLLIVVLSLMVVSAFAAPGYADLSGSATATVFAKVKPNVSMIAKTPIVDAGSVQVGDFSATIRFRVDANMESVSLFVEASDLYKGDDPTNPEVSPIDLNLSKGATISPTNANPVAGGSNVAGYIGAGAPISNFPTEKSRTIMFESSQNGRFSQDVMVQVWYTQNDSEKPMGEYSGKVRLTAFLTP